MPKLEEHNVDNFQTLIDAAQVDRLCLADCLDKETGKPVRLVCAVNQYGGDGETAEEYELIPLAQMLECDPFEKYAPPGYDLPKEKSDETGRRNRSGKEEEAGKEDGIRAVTGTDGSDRDTEDCSSGDQR